MVLSESFNFVRASSREGACDPQERAQGRPGPRCTRGLMCIDAQKNAHTSIQVQRKHSGLPCAMALRLIRALPGDRAFLPPSPARCRSIIANLTPASGRQDHTTSPYALAPFVIGTSASITSRPAFRDDRERPFWWDETAKIYNHLDSASRNIYDNPKLLSRSA